MQFIQEISLFSMSALYVTAGILHFVYPRFYLKITPKWVPYPENVNLFVGGIEIVLGLALLFEITRPIAAIGIIALLIAVFPANIYHFKKSWKKRKNVIFTLLRLPMQALLIYWAASFL